MRVISFTQESGAFWLGTQPTRVLPLIHPVPSSTRIRTSLFLFYVRRMVWFLISALSLCKHASLLHSGILPPKNNKQKNPTEP